MTFVNIDAIMTGGRTLQPGDDVSDLAKHINDSGLQYPILTDPQHRLIDGLRRLEAHRLLGRTQIEVLEISNSLDLMSALHNTKEHGHLAVPIATYERMWELYNIALAMRSETRSLLLKGKPRNYSIRYSVTEAMAEIFDLNLAAMHAFVALFRMRLKETVNQTRVEEAIALLEAGDITVHAALGRVRRDSTPQGRINNVGEQRQALQSMAASLNGLGHVIDQMGRLNPRIPKEEVAQYLQGMDEFRSKLHKLRKAYSEENNKR